MERGPLEISRVRGNEFLVALIVFTSSQKRKKTYLKNKVRGGSNFNL